MGYTRHVKRATISLQDDLAEAVDNYLQAQEVRPALTTVMQVALREYLSARGFLRVRRASRMTPKGEQRPKRREP
jgi:metal-responsive CopG/Arc/MetJ family transcriptional regulator